MATDFKRANHVEWNSETEPVRVAVKEKVTSEITFKS